MVVTLLLAGLLRGGQAVLLVQVCFSLVLGLLLAYRMFHRLLLPLRPPPRLLHPPLAAFLRFGVAVLRLVLFVAILSFPVMAGAAILVRAGVIDLPEFGLLVVLGGIFAAISGLSTLGIALPAAVVAEPGLRPIRAVLRLTHIWRMLRLCCAGPLAGGLVTLGLMLLAALVLPPPPQPVALLLLRLAGLWLMALTVAALARFWHEVAARIPREAEVFG